MSRKITVSEMREILDMWSLRAHRLREYWMNGRAPMARRERAYGLWVLMVKRSMRLSNAIALAQLPKFTGKFKPGGITTNTP